MANVSSRLFSRSGRRRRRSYQGAAAAVEFLETRAVLSPGSLLWAQAALDYKPGDDDGFADVAVQNDGKVVAVGTIQNGADTDFLVARFTAAGRVDRSFGSGGIQVFGFGDGRDDVAASVALQPDGKIVVGGRSMFGPQTTPSGALARLNRDGGFDDSFGPGGRRLTNPGGGRTAIDVVNVTAEGRILATGSRNTVNGFLARYESDGDPDGSFNAGNGYLLVDGQFTDFALAADGRIVALTGSGVVARFTAAGSVDTTFGAGGASNIELRPGNRFGLFDRTTAIQLTPDGRIVVAGYFQDGSAFRAGVTRLSSNGFYDFGFDGDGRAEFAVGGLTNSYLRDVAVLPNGGVVVAGYGDGSNTEPFAAVLTAAGALDTAFGREGIRVQPLNGDDFVSAVAVTREGHYVLAGGVDSGDTDARLLAFEGRHPRRDDALGWAGDGDWYAAASTGAAFANRYFGTWNPAAGWRLVATADVTGDGLADAVGRDGTGQWWVGVNTGAAFATVTGPKWNEAAGWRDVRFADFNGDGKADVAARTSYGEWWVSLSTGTGLGGGRLWDRWNEAANWRDVLTADFNGDGRQDLAGRTSGGEWWVALSQDGRFTQRQFGGWGEAAGWRDVSAADFDGDGRADVAGRTAAGQWWVARSTGSRFDSEFWGAWNEAAGWRDVRVGDFNRDGRMDVAGRTAGGGWYVGLSFENASGRSFNTANRAWVVWNEAAGWRDVRAGDFDGDGQWEVAGRSSDGRWWVARNYGLFFVSELWGGWNEDAGWKVFGGEFAPTV